MAKGDASRSALLHNGLVTSYSTIERSTTIAAPAAVILPLITDLHRWVTWSPWEGLDPELNRAYSGPAKGVGSVYEWSGNRKAGAGTMEITAVTDDLVDIDVTFTRPFKSASKVRFTLVPDGPGTRVVWQMRTPKNLGMRIAGLFMNMDKAIGADLEKGLAALREQAEPAAGG